MDELKLTIIKAQCSAKGVRMTEQRRVVARVLTGSADHLDVELYAVPLADDEAKS